MIITTHIRSTPIYKLISWVMSWDTKEPLPQEDTDKWIHFLLKFPENKWFEVSNKHDGVFRQFSAFDDMVRLVSEGLVEDRKVPVHDEHNMNGKNTGRFTYHLFRFRFDLQYDSSPVEEAEEIRNTYRP